jgi:hypothetical protein
MPWYILPFNAGSGQINKLKSNLNNEISVKNVPMVMVVDNKNGKIINFDASSTIWTNDFPWLSDDIAVVDNKIEQKKEEKLLSAGVILDINTISKVINNVSLLCIFDERLPTTVGTRENVCELLVKEKIDIDCFFATGNTETTHDNTNINLSSSKFLLDYLNHLWFSHKNNGADHKDDDHKFSKNGVFLIDGRKMEKVKVFSISSFIKKIQDDNVSFSVEQIRKFIHQFIMDPSKLLTN